MIAKLKHFIRSHPLFCLLLLSLITRFLWVRFGIHSITDDETDIYTSAYILAKTGRDYYGNSFFLTTGILTPKPVVPVLIAAVPWLFTSIKTVFLARLPFVLLNSLTPVLMYYLVQRITKNSLLALLSFAVFNFSPWFSYASVTGYEAMVALFFVMLFFAVAVSPFKRGQKMVLGTVISFLIFNSYQGMKPVYPFLVFSGLIMYAIAEQIRLNLRKYLLYGLISLSLFMAFVAINYYAPNAELTRREYSTMTTYYDKGHEEGAVWYERLTTSGPPAIARLISNKYMLRVRDYATKYMLSFDPAIYFQKGDPSATYGTADLSGLFFITDFVFFIIGLVNVWHFKKKGYKLLLLLIFFGGIPVVLATTSPTLLLRGILLVIPYTMIIAYGMYMVVSVRKNKLIPTALVLLFLVNTAVYMTVFNLRIINMIGEKWKYGFMQVSQTVPQVQKGFTKVTIYYPEAEPFFFQYSFLNNTDARFISTAMRNKKYQYGNLAVTTSPCPKKPPGKNELIVINSEFCNPKMQNAKTLKRIASLDRSGQDYYFITGAL